jgi:hypothetical protein
MNRRVTQSKDEAYSVLKIYLSFTLCNSVYSVVKEVLL